MTAQPGPEPGEARSAGQLLRPLRDIAALVAVAAPAVLLFVAVIRLIPSSFDESWSYRARDSFYSFVNLQTIGLPLLGVLLATVVRPVHPRARLVTVVALADYAVAAVFGIVFGVLIGLVQVAATVGGRVAFEELLVRAAWLAVFAVAGYAIFQLWRNLFRPAPRTGYAGPPPYGQQPYGPGPYGQQPYPGPPGQSFPPPHPGHGQPPHPGHGQPPQPGHGQPPQPGHGQPPPAPPAWGQPPMSGPPMSGPPASGPSAPGQPMSGPPAPGQPRFGPPDAGRSPAAAPAWAQPTPPSGQPGPRSTAGYPHEPADRPVDHAEHGATRAVPDDAEPTEVVARREPPEPLTDDRP